MYYCIQKHATDTWRLSQWETSGKWKIRSLAHCYMAKENKGQIEQWIDSSSFVIHTDLRGWTSPGLGYANYIKPVYILLILITSDRCWGAETSDNMLWQRSYILVLWVMKPNCKHVSKSATWRCWSSTRNFNLKLKIFERGNWLLLSPFSSAANATYSIRQTS